MFVQYAAGLDNTAALVFRCLGDEIKTKNNRVLDLDKDVTVSTTCINTAVHHYSDVLSRKQGVSG